MNLRKSVARGRNSYLGLLPLVATGAKGEEGNLVMGRANERETRLFPCLFFSRRRVRLGLHRHGLAWRFGSLTPGPTTPLCPLCFASALGPWFLNNLQSPQHLKFNS
jgi:hypothetical protein